MEYLIDDNKKNIYCANCGKKGHKIKNCNYPIVSYGIICIKLYIDEQYIDLESILKYIRNTDYEINDKLKLIYNKISNIDKIDDYLKFLLINRKYTLNYIELIRGKYEIDNINYIVNAINFITNEERNILLNNNFDYIWNTLWCDNYYKNNFENEYEKSKKKFEILKKGFIIDNIYYSLENIINNSKINFIDTEWEIPKGKKNLNENDLDCSLREFYEETNIEKNKINILNINQIEETFMGTNLSKYKNIYYLAQITNNNNLNHDLNYYQKYEVKNINWFNIKGSLKIIRDYHFEKKNTLNFIYLYINNLINKFKNKFKNNFI